MYIIYKFPLCIYLMIHISRSEASYLSENWTSCEEFLRNTTLNYTQLVDVDWKIFYFWNWEKETSYNIKFSIASSILTDRFKVELREKVLNVNWSRAVLFMETSIDFSALYLETDTPGKFKIIPSLFFKSEFTKIPDMLFGLKWVEPGYLGILNCERRLCYGLASFDKMPAEKDIQSAAQKLGFHGDHSRTYLDQTEPLPQISPYMEDDSDDDAQIEIDNDYEL